MLLQGVKGLQRRDWMRFRRFGLKDCEQTAGFGRQFRGLSRHHLAVVDFYCQSEITHENSIVALTELARQIGGSTILRFLRHFEGIPPDLEVNNALAPGPSSRQAL